MDELTQRHVAATETHLSSVFFTENRAYKLLKPLDLGFVDFTDRAARVAAVTREIDLNRRLAPDVYLGLADVYEHDELVDRMIVMRRLPEERRLSAMIATSEFSGCLRAVARLVAAFHAGLPPDPLGATVAGRDALRRNWDDNLAVIGRAVGADVDPAVFQRIEALVHGFLHHRGALFERRLRDGMVRDGHGDLLTEDIFCLDDGPRILDCLAFRDDLRVGDVLLDIAFLAMDVERLAGAAAGEQVMRDYQEFSNEHHPDGLAHHYIAYRAGVRAKVAQLRIEQGGGGVARDELRRHVELCGRHLEEGRVRMILVGGGSGVGKSTLAADMGHGLGFTVLGTDETRQEVSGLNLGEHAYAPPGQGLYRSESVDAVYGEMLRRAELLLVLGESVILDATWTAARHRTRARELGESSGADVIEIECRLAPELAKDRITRRSGSLGNASDATPSVVDYQTGMREPWPEAAQVDMRKQPFDVAAEACHMVRAR